MRSQLAESAMESGVFSSSQTSGSGRLAIGLDDAGLADLEQADPGTVATIDPGAEAFRALAS